MSIKETYEVYDVKRKHEFNEWVRFYYDRIIPRPASLVAGGYPEGVDVSRWNGSFDPDLSQHEIKFAFQKLTEGTTWIDPLVEQIWAGVAKVPVRGGYHYIRSGYSWLTQVNHFLSVFNRHDYHIAIVDLESNGGDNVLSDTLYADTRRWIDEVRTRTSKRTILYTNLSIWTLFKAAIKRMYADGEAWLASLDLWLAWPSLTASEPPIPCKLWQYRWDGKGYGTGSVNCDVNRFIGTEAELYVWADATTPPPDGGNVIEDKYMIVTDAVSSLNVRSSDSNLGTGNDLGDFQLTKGDIVHVIEMNPNTMYHRFDAWYRGGVFQAFPVPSETGYWASEGSTTKWLADTVFTPPVEPPPASEPAVMEIMLADGSKVFVKDLSGNVLFEWPK